MKFKVGDKVKVVCRGSSFIDCMMRYIGTVHTVIDTTGDNINPAYILYGGDGFIFDEESLELISNNKIVITVSGDETIAKMYDGEKVVKTASAKCSPSDKFDFETGAKLAFDRLMDKEKFVPHLKCIGLHYGNIGEPTNYKDAVEKQLYIGDEVELFYNGICNGKRSIVKRGDKCFVMGIESDCNEKNGTIKNRWKILKKRSYKDINDGENVDGVEYIKENVKC